jgi:hypothetical protein
MYTTFTQFTPAIHLRRSRVLPVVGTVMVRQGQKVNSDDVIAEAVIPTRHEMVDVAKALGLSSSKAAEALIQRKVGETISEQDILAETGGLFSRIIRTPAPGKIIGIREGKILIQTETTKLSVKALYSGSIAEIIPDRGAIIETSGSLIQAAWGNGKFAVGPLLTKIESRKTAMVAADLAITARGSIIASSSCNNENLLENAAALPVAGLILGTMPAALIEKARALPFPILLVDGFGTSGLNNAAAKYLSQYNNHECYVNASMQFDASYHHPEILISAAIENTDLGKAARATAGQLVRIHSGPFASQTGTIEKVLPGLTALPNGLRVCAASVIMENKERKIIPVYNLDGIGFTQN